MCGIFGAIGKNIDPAVIVALAALNRSRGQDSIGFATVDGAGVVNTWKRAGDPWELLRSKQFARHKRGWSGKWAVLGHTRYGTRGKPTERNAHPFTYGAVTGMHNGIVSAPAKYEVDSEYLFDLLAQHSGDYQKALEHVDGHWGLAWTDGDFVWLQAHNQSLAYARHNGAVYYASDDDHLGAALAIVGRPRVERFTEGETWLIDHKGRMTAQPDFVSRVERKVWSGKHGGSYYTGSACGTSADYDERYLPVKYRDIGRGYPETVDDVEAVEAQIVPTDEELADLYDAYAVDTIDTEGAVVLYENRWLDYREIEDLAQRNVIERDWWKYLRDDFQLENDVFDDHVNRG